MSSSSNISGYLPQLDGLRAVAVLAVIINHFDANLLPSGYLGVDIFFVISGFVITMSVLSVNKIDRRFAFKFFEKRLKRLLPALLFYVIVVAILICFVNPYPQLALRTGLSSLLGFSNLYLLKQSVDYFSHSTELNPYTQTWSLGIEEQFYLLFPLLVMIAGPLGFKKNREYTYLFLVSPLVIASLAYFIYFYPINLSVAYFSPLARFWEIGIGSILYILLIKWRQYENSKASRLLLSMIVALTLTSFFFPVEVGLYSTVLIVALSCLLISFSLKAKSSVFHKVLSSFVFVRIGRLSYSLYLWHWGVLALSRWTIGVHWWSVLPQLLLIWVISEFSYRYIENPLRRANFLHSTVKNIIFGITVIGAFVSSLYFLSLNSAKLYAGKSLTYPQCPIFDGGSPASAASGQWVVGDSHAVAFGKSLFSATEGDCVHFTQDTGNSFLFNRNVLGNTDVPDVEVELLDPSLFVAHLKTYSPDYVFVAPYWLGYFAPPNQAIANPDFIARKWTSKSLEMTWQDAFDTYISSLGSVVNSVGSKFIVVLPPPRFDWIRRYVARPEFCQKQWFQLSISDPNCPLNHPKAKVDLRFFEDQRSYFVDQLSQFAAAHRNVHLFDPVQFLCSESSCETEDESGNYLFDDSHHVSGYGSSLYVGKLKEIINP